MRDVPALIASVDQVAGVATATIRGEFGSSAYSRLRDRLAWVAEPCPQKLVLDLGVSDRCTEQLVAFIADARRQLPMRCLLGFVRLARPCVTCWNSPGGLVQVTAARQEAEPARPGDQGQA
jgi:hypothetical protein